jgi:hypothetical protein
MVDTYSVKINRQEGALEVTGDKDWVSSKLNELKEIYSEYVPQPKAESSGDILPTQSKKSPKRQAGTARAQKNSELEAKLTKELKEKLAAYVSERQVSFDHSLPSQAAIIARFLQEELGWAGVDQHDMYTVYATMGWRSPGNPAAQLNNALSRNHYFSSITEGKYVLSHAGENYASHDSLNIQQS